MCLARSCGRKGVSQAHTHGGTCPQKTRGPDPRAAASRSAAAPGLPLLTPSCCRRCCKLCRACRGGEAGRKGRQAFRAGGELLALGVAHGISAQQLGGACNPRYTQAPGTELESS